MSNTPFPLTSPQRQIWFDQMLHGDAPVYNIGGYMHLCGPMDGQLFVQATELLVQKHDVLRTVLVADAEGDGQARRQDDGLPQQYHADARLPEIGVLDFSSAPMPHAAALAWMEQEFARPFVLDGGMLCRFALLQLGQDESHVFVCYHHLIADGWAIALLARSHAALYSALLAGTAPDMAAPSYRVFAADDQAYLGSPAFARQADYWRQKFEAPVEKLFAPRHRGQTATGHAGAAGRSQTSTMVLPRHWYNQLGQLAHTQGAGAFHAILAALHVHFTRPFHQPDQSAGPQQRELVVGLPVQNRGNAAFKATAGTFVGMTAARLRFDGGLNFAELLRGIASTLRQDYRHQRYPIQALNEQFSAADGAHRALFDIGLSYERHDHGVGYGQASGVATALTTGYQSTPLMLYVREFRPDQDVLVDFVFNQACFDVAEIAALQQRLRHLLDTALATPLAAISSLPLLTDAELRQVTIDFNRTAIDHGSLEPVFQQFEHQVRRTPLAIALVWEAEHHTYHGLNQLANRLANSLIQAGVLPDELVCIHAARSVEQVAGLLAIMKAGAAYVPLDPDNPAERLAFMLQDSGARWVLAPSQLWLASGLQASACRHLPLDLPALQGFADTNPALDIGTGQLAYMMYTSGSTGKPKGAGISHAALANRLQWMQHSHALTARDRVLQKTPIGFDVSVWEYFWPLMAGATLVVARPGDHQDPARLSAIMAREAVTTMHFVPSMLAAFIEHGGLQDKPALRQVFASGEALSGELARRFLRQSSARLFNLYGPTEAAIDVTAWECQDDGASSVPIGRPIANTQIYLLDEAMRPVPVGTPGKLYIGGVQLARGYHRRPALTAERFVPNPFGAPGTRLYDSGDLACWRSDGAIDYLGRDDDQVKIRGVRIELGEVEAALLSHDGVREAVVVARDDDGHGKRLVAYVVLREEPAPMAGAVAPQMQGGMADADADADPDAGTAVRSTFRSTFCSTSFKQALADRLPQQYVPDHVICLASMPLSRNGKIDRRALPAPRLAMAPPARSSPMDATQKLLATLWRALLGLDDTVPISRQDHFFDLGGHSLLAVRLLAQLRQQAGIELPLRAVFEAPRLEQMAQTIDARRERADCASANAAPEAEMLPALRRADRQSPLPLSFAQQRLWFLDRLEPHGVTYNMAGGLRLSGKLDAVALEAAINTVVQRHDMLRTVFDMAGDSAVQIVKPQAHVCLTVTDLSTLPMPLRQTQAQQLAQNDAMLAFDLRAAPLLRTRLLVLGAREHWLVVSLHHIIADGWSMSVLVRDIAAAYNCHVAGTPMALPALPAQYADFALWQRQLRQTPQWELQLDYWRAQLAGAPALLLPTDHPRPAARTDHGAAFSWQLPAALVQGLRAAGRGQHATLFMTLLSAFGALLSRYSSQDDICIGVPVANRQHAALDGLIGCFVNLLVLRMRFAEGMVFADILRQMRETALAAYANQDIAFEQLVEALRIERDLSHAPLFQVMFTLHEEALGGAMRAPFAGLEQAPLEVRLPVAKFDLSLEMWEDSDGLRARLEYSTDLFEHATIERMAENFGCLLAALAETDNAHVPVARLELITPAQRHFLLEELNQSACAFPLSSSYAALFAQQVALHPQRVAAVCLDERLTYAELDLRSTRLAQALRAAGAAPNVLVGVAGPRDLCYLAMMVAICKAGAAYVPLDVNHPATRLREILVRGRIPMVLVSQLTPAMITQLTGGLETMPVVLDAQAIWLEEDAAAAALPLPALPCGPDDLAYVIFTSGSTGQPKGAMVEQRGMLNNLYGKLPVLGLGAHDRVAQTASPAFDISVWQFLAAPLLGACVHIMPDDVAHDPARLHDALSAQQVTILQVVPNMLRQLGEVAPSDAPLALRWVLSIGEALAPSVAAAWFARFPAIALINIYGPAECADNVTWLALPDAAALAPYAALASVPVGRPTPNTQMFVLDAFLQLLPVGVPGEICIAGAGVGRGYLE
ncbi:MAG: amino acid adenylation domain-containing protein, partial [Janthinobacterium lividum]